MKELFENIGIAASILGLILPLFHILLKNKFAPKPIEISGFSSLDNDVNLELVRYSKINEEKKNTL